MEHLVFLVIAEEQRLNLYMDLTLSLPVSYICHVPSQPIIQDQSQGPDQLQIGGKVKSSHISRKRKELHMGEQQSFLPIVHLSDSLVE